MKTRPDTPTQNSEGTTKRSTARTTATPSKNRPKNRKESPEQKPEEKESVAYYPAAQSSKYSLNKRIKSVNIATDDPEYVAQFFKLMRQRFEENKKQKSEEPYYPPCYFESWDE